MQYWKGENPEYEDTVKFYFNNEKGNYEERFMLYPDYICIFNHKYQKTNKLMLVIPLPQIKATWSSKFVGRKEN